MKLTPKQLKTIIKEELGKLDLNAESLHPDIASYFQKQNAIHHKIVDGMLELVGMAGNHEARTRANDVIYKWKESEEARWRGPATQQNEEKENNNG